MENKIRAIEESIFKDKKLITWPYILTIIA